MTITHAQPYFCTDQGTRLEYVRTEGESGKKVYSHVMSILDVKTDAAGVHVDYSSDFHKASGTQMYGGPVALHALVTPQDAVCLDPGESMSSVFRNIFPGAKVTSTGAETILPSTLVPGISLPDASCTVSVAGVRYRVDITERKVLRNERIVTPAGSFDCVVITEHKVEKGPGRNRVTTALTWYARGVGMVRHDTYDRNMVLETSEILNKFLPSRK